MILREDNFFMKRFWQQHKFVSMILILTSIAWLTLMTRTSIDQAPAQRWNGVSVSSVVVVYVVILVGLLITLRFESRIIDLLKRFQWVVLVLSAVTCFLIIQLLEPNQEHRLFITPFSTWVIIAHAVSICGILVWMTFDPVKATLSSYRIMVILLVGAALVLIALYVASLSEFMYLDSPDEPWLASMATNYAQHGDLSPSFIGSPYGSPDPVLPRYYLLMGLVVKASGSSLSVLRLLPLLVGLLALAIVAYILWTQILLTLASRLTGVVALISLSVFLRTSHNLRPDIGLAVYGAVILLALIRYFSGAGRASQWLIVMGAALYPALETIPFMAVMLGVVVGLAIIVFELRERSWRTAIKMGGIYLGICILSFVVYGAAHFLPNIPSALAGFQKFNRFYSSSNSVGSFHDPFPGLVNYYARFSLILSPLEIIVYAGALGILWRDGSKTERWILGVFGLTSCLMLVFTAPSYGYWSLFTPVLAYALARAVNVRRILMVGVFALIPALIAPSIYDLGDAIAAQRNESQFETISSLTSLIPENSVVIADDVFWFTIRPDSTVIGLSGIEIYHLTNHINYSQAVTDLKVDMLLCEQGDERCDWIAATGLFSEPQIVQLNKKTYLIYHRI